MIFLFGVIIISFCRAQQFPVTITIAVSPPYPPKVNEYTAQPNKIMATLVNTSTQVKQVYVQGSITGEGGIKVYTDPNYKMPQPLMLQPGIPFQMNQGNIQQVFSSDHLVFRGITKNEILYGTGLPEGDYTICLQAFDYNTNQQVSQPSPQGCSNTFTVTSIEPPVVLQPVCGEPVIPGHPQNIIFSWTRPPGATVNTQFNLKIIEVLPTDRNINDAMRSATHPAFFETTIRVTSYILGPSDPQLVIGKKYAFAVTAIDPAGQATFRNSGMSEVCSISYGRADSISNVFYTVVQNDMIVHIEAGYMPDTDNSQFVDISLPSGKTVKVKIKDNGGVKLVLCNWIIIKQSGTEKDSDGKTITVITKYLLITKNEVDAIGLKTAAKDSLKKVTDATKNIGTAVRLSLANESESNALEMSVSSKLDEILKDKELPAGDFKDSITDAKKNIDEALKKEEEAKKKKDDILKTLPGIEAERKKIIGKLEKALTLEMNKEDDKEIKKDAIKEMEALQKQVNDDLDNINKALDIEADVLKKKGVAEKRIIAALKLYGDLAIKAGKWKISLTNAQSSLAESIKYVTASIKNKNAAKDNITKLKSVIDSALDKVKDALIKETS